MARPPSDSRNKKDAASYPSAPLPLREITPGLRPREALAQRGAALLSDDTLLAILLRSGRPGRNVVELARDTLQAFDGLEPLARASFEEIASRRISGLGRVKAMEIAAAFELGRRAAAQQTAGEAPYVRDPESVFRQLRPLAASLRQEVFWALLLDTRNRLIGRPLEVTRGLLDTSPVHPREVFNLAVRHSAAAVILAHNHPSGDPSPSPEDLRVTRQLVEAARILGIRVLDHVIVGRETDTRPGHLSLREQGLATFDGV